MRPARVPTADDETDDVSPVDPREAYRVQVELLRVLHADGIARTRDNGRSWIGGFVPFIVGLLLGVTGTLAALTGRLATVETKLEAQQHEITANRDATAAGFAEVKGAIQELTRSVNGMTIQQRSGRP